MSRAVVPVMLESGGGSLVHLGSDSARLPHSGNQDYAAAKPSLLALFTSLATEFSPQGIRSNVVIPGPTLTPLYDGPNGFAEQAAQVWGTDRETALTRMTTEVRPLLTGRSVHARGLPKAVLVILYILMTAIAVWIAWGFYTLMTADTGPPPGFPEP
jgi:NAD(P)-dependent dehydrogenase (short-subunit alcohol dehydrogenase family)